MALASGTEFSGSCSHLGGKLGSQMYFQRRAPTPHPPPQGKIGEEWRGEGRGGGEGRERDRMCLRQKESPLETREEGRLRYFRV